VLEENILARLGTAHLLGISGPAGDSGFPEFSDIWDFSGFQVNDLEQDTPTS
jgi:hypothetical protein